MRHPLRSPRPLRGLVAVLALATAAAPLLTAPAGAEPSTSAPRKADVSVTLRTDPTVGLAGRVSSERRACEAGVGVALFSRSQGEVSLGGSTVTDDRGRYPSEGPVRRRGVAPDATVFTVVPGDERCRPAQSPSLDAPDIEIAASRAAVKVSLTFDEMGPRGRVTSAREGCSAGVAVLAFGRSSASQPWFPLGITESNQRGRYTFAARRVAARGAIGELTALTVQSKRCAIGQSGVAAAPLT